MEHVSELIPAYVLGALDPAEAELVDRHVATCAACGRELDAARETVAMLAFTVEQVPPPPDLRERILDAVAEPELVPAPQPEPEPAPATEAAGGGWSWWPRFARIATPVLAVCVIGLVAWNISLRHSLSDTNHTVYDSATSVALTNVGTVFVQKDGSATLYSDPGSLPAGKTYQAWVIPAGGGKPVSAGLFGAGRSNMDLTTKAAPGDTIAVTVEPSGGSPQPTSQPIAGAKVA